MSGNLFEGSRQMETNLPDACSELHDRLSWYLKKQKIGAANFRCENEVECRTAVASVGGTFTPASDTEFGMLFPTSTFKIVHVSLDPPTGCSESERTLASGGTPFLNVPYDKRRFGWWNHWYWLLRITGPLLRAVGIQVEDLEAHYHLAHTRAARCSSNREGGASAPQPLFERCWRYLPGEIEILDPSLILSMGENAKLALEKSFPGFTTVDGEDIRTVSIQGRSVLWIVMPHPNRRGPFHQARRERLSVYCDVVRAECMARSPSV